MIKIQCHTNLDLSNEKWPQSFPCVPRIGDDIQSLTEHEKGFKLMLKVVAVRWKENSGVYVPYVELSCRDTMSIYTFYKWYAPLVGKGVSAFI